MTETQLMKKFASILAKILPPELAVYAAAGAWTATDATRTKLLDGTFDIDTDSYKVALFLSTSNLGAGSTLFSGVTNEHAAQYGYTAGGIAVTLTLAGTTSVKVTTSTEIKWTASGGSILAKYACLYEVGGNVLAYCQLDAGGANVEATDGNYLQITPHANGIFTLA